MPAAFPLSDISARFAIDLPITLIEPLGRGLINDTFRVEAKGRSYVLQRINRTVFPKPEQIMANLLALTRHPREPGASGCEIPGLILTRGGESFTRDACGDVWRLVEFIPNSISLTRVEDRQQALEVGRLLGRFHRWVGAIPIERLGTALPDFHATPAYLERLRQAITRNPSSKASAEIRQLVDFATARASLARVLEDASRTDRISRRVTHGDPKLDNILFAQDGSRAIALIDLDTVQPGLIQHDLGDCLRSCCNTHGEGDPDPAAVRFDLTICAGILAGYAEATRGFLSENDIGYFYDAIRLLPFELGLRFLTDHLEGDHYFKVERPGQNLAKARIQFALLADIESKEREIRTIVGCAFKPAN